MATIDDLPRKSVTEMSDDELVEVMRLRRKMRITPVKPVKEKAPPGTRAVKAQAKEAKVAGKSANELYSMMTPEMKRAMMNQLKGTK